MGTPKISRTPRAVAKPASGKSPFASKKPAPNASILSFFKKVPAPEETLFVGGAHSNQGAVPEDGVVNDSDELQLERYAEDDTPAKRRKLGNDNDEKHEPEEDPPTLTGDRRAEPANDASKTSSLQKSRRKGPFLDDSDSEADNHEHVIAIATDAPPIRPPAAPVIADSPGKSPSPTSPSPGNDRGPYLIKQEQRMHDFTGCTDVDAWTEADHLGEEDRERMFMEEQFRLEPEEAASAVDAVRDIFPGPVKPMEAEPVGRCPVCASSLAGVTTDQATIHVNSCLDGSPAPLHGLSCAVSGANSTPVASTTTNDDSGVDAGPVNKRLLRAAVSRPGQSNPITLEGSASSSSSNSAFSKLMSGHAEDSAWATAAAAEVSSRGKQAYQRTCPFYKIMPNLSICVDAFRYGAVEGCKAYFLSHFHSDHYVGLTANWNHGPIYCSKVTGSLVRSQLRTAAKYVVELEFEEKFVVPGTDNVVVTMIPANHCPGSSLFLFEKVVARGGNSRLQRILHCGDFRACPAHVDHPQLRPTVLDRSSGKIVKRQKIDVCYLDTTYLNPRYSFPPQDDVIRSCAELCATLNRGLQEQDQSVWAKILSRREGASGSETLGHFWVNGGSCGMATPNQAKHGGNSGGGAQANALTAQNPGLRLLVVCGTYSIGKERICKAIAQALRTKIFASPSKIRIVSQLGDPELAALMTSNPAEAQVHMQMLAEIRAETLADYLSTYRAHFGRVVGFRPSGWNYRSVGTASNASAQPSSVATQTILHSGAWRTNYTAKHLIPQRGSTSEAMCFGVPYSEHSSFRELALFLMSLDIEKVVPTVNVGSEVSRKRMKAWIDRWLAERRRGGLTTLLHQAEDMTAGASNYENRAGAIAEDCEEKRGGTTLWHGKDGKGGSVIW